MIALAVAAPSLSCDFDLIRRDGGRRDFGRCQELIQRIARLPPTTAFHHQGSFQHVRYRHATGRGGDQRLETRRLVLAEEHRQQCGRVHDHLGSPRSS